MATSNKYGPLHALAAGAVLVYIVLSNGLPAFWNQFLHGINIEFTDKNLLPLLGANTLLFGGLFFILWLSTLFQRHPYSAENGVSPLRRCLPALAFALPICTIALVINWASAELISLFTDINLSDQDLVKVVTSNTFSPANRAILYSFLLFEAPLLEEPLFRGVVFGGLTKVMPVWAAMAISGFLFALIHVNAATFIPLWFLGIAFAWLYVRTGTLLAPMAVHFIFNALNLALCLLV